MELKRAGSQPSMKGPVEWFTGTVRIDPLNTAPPPARVSCASVTFEPGARTAWHTHPLGQTLIVTAGCGWTQCEGQAVVHCPVQVIRDLPDLAIGNERSDGHQTAVAGCEVRAQPQIVEQRLTRVLHDALRYGAYVLRHSSGGALRLRGFVQRQRFRR